MATNLATRSERSETTADTGTAATTLAAPGARRELARFLKAKRAALDPRANKVVVTSRRAKGLLREEVSRIAGMSVTWYTWLEQGRPTQPSPAVLDALAGALKLTPAERKHLYRLARPDLDARVPSALATRVTPAIAALLEGLAPHPAYAVNGAWDVLAENAPAQALFGSFFASAEVPPNVLARLVLDPSWRELFVDHDRIVESAVAQFRASTAASRLRDPSIHAVVGLLSRKSERFRALWARTEVTDVPAWRKTLRRGKRLLSFDYATFHPDSEPDDVRITVYTPADAQARAAATRLFRGG